MQTFLLVVAGLVVGTLVLLALGWFWLKRKLKQFGASLAAMAGHGITPFRITLVPVEGDPSWDDPESADRATDSFESLGYQRVGDFSVPEMADVTLRGFSHESERFYAVLYELPEVGLVGDAVCSLTDGTHWTVSTAPVTGLARPDWAPLVTLEADVGQNGATAGLHTRLVEEAGGHDRRPTPPDGFEKMFLDSYHEEMDWRIERGGPTAEEIRGAARFGDLEEPDDESIELIQSMWRQAIEAHFDEQVQSAFLEQSQMLAGEWEEIRDRVAVIHDRSDRVEKISDLAWHLAGLETGGTDPDGEEYDSLHERMQARLEPVFADRSVREAFRVAQDLLPEDRRYEPLGTVSDPLAADVYLYPELPEEY